MPAIELQLNPPSALIHLNRPEARNALSSQLVKEFQRTLDEIEARAEIAAVVITGAGTAFCAGADLRELSRNRDQPIEEARRDALSLLSLFRRLFEYPKAVIAAVNGATVGGGCGLVGASDLAVASEKAFFAFGEVRVGMVPALVSVLLLRCCPEKKAREWLLTGRRFSALEAQGAGLVNEVVPASQLLDRAQQIAGEIASNSPAALALTKELIPRLPGLDLEPALSLAAHFNALARTTQDFREGVKAFLEKRPPVWTRSR